jgi:hypothetical protein
MDAPTSDRLWPLYSIQTRWTIPMLHRRASSRTAPVHSIHARIVEGSASACAPRRRGLLLRFRHKAYVLPVTTYLPMAMFAWIAAVAVRGLPLVWQITRERFRSDNN